MHYLVYTSTANFPLTIADLRRLLGPWRANNARAQVTGVLLYSEGQILQVLEGEADALHALFAIIAADARHRNVTKLADGRAQGRAFAEWSMQFRTVDPQDFAQFVQQMNTAAGHTARLAPVLASFMAPEQPWA
ncbi:BLUF domain-containing protein [Hymenobacter coccineus]|uniref:BLUF domain-containing protein n=1 Tax=Hymenobacter coccineus TaxID=1908235 RepID=A0A1G1TIL2_9BACT|nr:BLUF domain-containing protein [Hymenobacter coccineus]OGX90715.1 hypothetical protein BEN49_21880 [Hymenobacter coccineus]